MKVKLADVWFVNPLGPPVIVVSGGFGVAVAVGDGLGEGDGVGVDVGRRAWASASASPSSTRIGAGHEVWAWQTNVYVPGVLNVQ